MKSLLLLLVLASCGKYDSSSSARLGQRLAYEPLELNESQLAQKERICNAISSKTNRLSLMHGSTLSFNISETNCSGESTQADAVNVRVEVSSNYIHFLRENGNFFIFKDAETLRSGIFKSYCETDKIPFLHNGNPTWIDQSQSEFCSPAASTACVNFKMGTKEVNSENTYKVVTQETFRLNTLSTSDRYGFYTERALQSTLSCESGTSIIRATLN